MGLFDYVYADDPRIVCSEGHAIPELQTKDLGCTMGSATITGGVLAFDNGGYNGYSSPIAPHPMTGIVAIYGDCQKCPAFVQSDTLNLCAAGADFSLALLGGRVTFVVRTSPSLAEWLAAEPLKPHMLGCWGPMPYADAWELHCSDNRPYRPWRGDQICARFWGAR